MIYLLLAFPLGIFYFVFFTVGTTLSIGLMPIFIGFPLALAVMKAAKHIFSFELSMGRHMLGAPIAPWDGRTGEYGGGLFRQLGAEFNNRAMYTSMIYLVFKFILGIISFVIVVTLVSLSLGFMASPLVYKILLNTIDVNILEDSLFQLLDLNWSSSTELFIYFLVGVIFSLATLHITNFIAVLQGKLLLALRDVA
jgi:hypothetical protein